MLEFASPTYMLELRNSVNRSCILSAKPGKEIQVLVRPAHDATAKPIVAKGTRSNDGVSFFVVVTRADGAQQTWNRNYRELSDEISVYQPD